LAPLYVSFLNNTLGLQKTALILAASPQGHIPPVAPGSGPTLLQIHPCDIPTGSVNYCVSSLFWIRGTLAEGPSVPAGGQLYFFWPQEIRLVRFWGRPAMNIKTGRPNEVCTLDVFGVFRWGMIFFFGERTLCAGVDMLCPSSTSGKLVGPGVLLQTFRFFPPRGSIQSPGTCLLVLRPPFLGPLLYWSLRFPQAYFVCRFFEIGDLFLECVSECFFFFIPYFVRELHFQDFFGGLV